MGRLTGLVAVAAMGLAACSGDDADPPAGDPEPGADTASPGDIDTTRSELAIDDPCEVLSEDEVSQILGFDVTATAGVASPTSCDYDSADRSGGVSLDVQNVAGDGCDPVFAVAGYGEGGGEPVDGVGTYAKFGGGFVPQLAVCFDDEVTVIASLGAESADPQATLVEVARAFETNLP
ncbi:MAG: DUF3558 domain-containing protein [Hyphomicrobiales bacterium]|nr:DUF3558 domain-containing protein [Hyphomicrobiales bacterium]